MFANRSTYTFLKTPDRAPIPMLLSRPKDVFADFRTGLDHNLLRYAYVDLLVDSRAGPDLDIYK